MTGTLAPQYTFGTLVAGLTGRFAHAAAVAVAEAPGTAYNPLFIHGGHGPQRTHLLHAIGNDRAPGRLAGIEDHLRTRFGQGLVADIVVAADGER